MINHFRKLQCFIIKRINYSEADKIITIFSFQKGKMTMIAKGLRKSKSRRGPTLELFNEIDLEAVKTNGMDIITEVNIIKDHCNFCENFTKTKIAYRIVELIDKLAPEKEENKELFFLLQKAFNYLDNIDLDEEKADKIALRFKLKILDILGFGHPKLKTLEEVSSFIEEIIQKKLVSKTHFNFD